jgi:hypothetical protein
MDIVIDREMREERVMYIARFWVSGLSVQERWDWRQGISWWVHASAKARFSTQRFGTLDIIVATHKADGDEGTKLSASHSCTIYCVYRPILQVMMISVVTQRPVQAVVLTNSHFVIHRRPYDQDLVIQDPKCAIPSDNIPHAPISLLMTTTHIPHSPSKVHHGPRNPLAIVAFACNSSASRRQPQRPWFSHAVKTSRLLQQP